MQEASGDKYLRDYMKTSEKYKEVIVLLEFLVDKNYEENQIGKSLRVLLGILGEDIKL